MSVEIEQVGAAHLSREELCGVGERVAGRRSLPSPRLKWDRQAEALGTKTDGVSRRKKRLVREGKHDVEPDATTVDRTARICMRVPPVPPTNIQQVGAFAQLWQLSHTTARARPGEMSLCREQFVLDSVSVSSPACCRTQGQPAPFRNSGLSPKSTL